MSEVAAVVNLRARRGSESIGRMVREILPAARVRVTRSLDEVRRWIDDDLARDPPRLLLSGGGDGTAIAMLNALRTRGVALPTLGVLPLGTGNGWARVTRAPRTNVALHRIAALRGSTPPTRRFALVESEGLCAPFLGTGWDAEIVSDFKHQLDRSTAAMRQLNAGLYGYLKGMFTRTIPRHIVGHGPPNVVLINLGDDALGVDENGNTFTIPSSGKGAVLYRGPASVAAAATTEEWGFGFRAFPFAHKVKGRLSVRCYGAGVLEATRNMFRLWRGEHPLPKMHDFLITAGRMEFDREVPFQIGGDLAGDRTSFEFRLSSDVVDLVDWARLPDAM
jgi:diacylglycerol kinase family enzyme